MRIRIAKSTIILSCNITLETPNALLHFAVYYSDQRASTSFTSSCFNTLKSFVSKLFSLIDLELAELLFNPTMSETNSMKEDPPSPSSNSATELQSLQRISHRLVLTDSPEKFTSIISKLLPKLLTYLGKPTNTPPIQSQLLQIISQIIQRCKTSPPNTVHLPLSSLLSLLYSPTSKSLLPLSSYTLNFTLAFLELSLPTSSLPLSSTLPTLITLFNSLPKFSKQGDQLSYIILECIYNDESNTVGEEIAEVLGKSKGVDSNLFDFFIDVLVYKPAQIILPASPSSSTPPTNPPTSTPPTTPAIPPFGMTSTGLTRLLSRRPYGFKSSSTLTAYKNKVINFVSPNRGGCWRKYHATTLTKSHFDLAHSSLSNLNPLGSAYICTLKLTKLTLGSISKPKPEDRRGLSPRQASNVMEFMCKYILVPSPDLFFEKGKNGLVLLTLLFTLSKKGYGSIDEKFFYSARAVAALDCLLNNYVSSPLSSQVLKTLIPILWNACASTKKSTRLSGVRWIGGCLGGEREGVQMLVFLSGDEDTEIGEEARKRVDSGTYQFNTLSELLLVPSSTSKRPTFPNFNSRSKAVTIKLLTTCYSKESSSDINLKNLLTAVLEIIKEPPNAASGRKTRLLDTCTHCLKSLLVDSSFTKKYILESRIITLKQFINLSISSSTSVSRKNLSIIFTRLLDNDENYDNDLVDKSLELCVTKLNFNRIFNASEANGAANLSSYVIDLVFRRGEVNDKIGEVIELLGKGLLHSDQISSSSCANALAIIFSSKIARGGDLLCKIAGEVMNCLNGVIKKYGISIEHHDVTRLSPFIKTAGVVLNSTHSLSLDDEDQVEELIDTLFNVLGSESYKKSNDIALTVGEALATYVDCVGHRVTKPLLKLEKLDEDYDSNYDKTLRKWERPIYRLLTKEYKAHNPQTRTASYSVLFAVVARGGEVGEEDKSNQFVKLLEQLVEVFQGYFVKGLKDDKGKQLSRECCCRGLAACYGFSKTLGSTFSTEINESLLKAFGQTTNHGGSAMMETREQEAVRRIQNAETEAEGRDALNAFLENGGGGPTAVEGGQAGVSEAALGAYREMAAAAIAVGGGNKRGGSTNVLYYLICLSTTHVVWSLEENKKYAASKLLKDDGVDGVDGGGVDLKALQVTLKPHLSKLAPKLLRACHDPNAQTREQMTLLWNSITGGKAEGRAVIKDNLSGTIDALCKDACSTLWRSRVGGCGALGEIIVGRGWEELGGGGSILDEDFVETKTAAGRLLTLWRVTMRALDDVRGNVRDSGENLGKSLRSLTIRLCDCKTAGISNEEGEFATSTILNWLIKHGLNQPCTEATQICISTLLGVVEVARAETLQPILPPLIGQLVCAMSGLEPSVLNYLQLRMGGEGGTESGERLESLRLQMAQNGPIGDALNKCVDVIKFSKLETKREVVRELGVALRNSVGAVSRCAVADTVNTLVNSSPEAFKSVQIGNPNCVKLLRALYFASERERGTGARDKLVFALGNLSSLAPEGAVRVLIAKLCDNYERACSSNGSLNGRRAASAAVAAIASRSPICFADGGKKDLFARRVLPVSFVGSFDSDEAVQNSWAKVWEEGGGAYMEANVVDETKFGVRLEEKLLGFVVSCVIEGLEDVSWSMRKSACQAVSKLIDSTILGPFSDGKNERTVRRCAQAARVVEKMVQCASSRCWNGKNVLLEALAGVLAVWLKGGEGERNISFFDSEEDLFLGDGFFGRVAGMGGEEEEEEEEEGVRMEIDKEEDGEGGEEEEGASDGVVLAGEEEGRSVSLSYLGLCKLMVGQSNKTSTASFSLTYRVAALEALAKIVGAFSDKKKQAVWTELTSTLALDEDLKPVLVAKRVVCTKELIYAGIDGVEGLALKYQTLSKHSAWTVREASCLFVGKLAELAGGLDRRVMTVLNDIVVTTLKDRKYAKCRVAGLKILKSLLGRAEREKEFLLPFVEGWEKVIKRSMGEENIGVTGVASEVGVLLSRL
ncbi:hypothetical protein TrLO_g5744 [Triparma laevis f. longispina]|uniref:Uncharacterized protein n=1 Tax=Triparma laevis f. longispina TaxID=1714387 RepID=A0A9W7KUP4_9STRA|nr:hypothetical protein TrLO_g5744 [Triparma laevis f. longispina]